MMDTFFKIKIFYYLMSDTFRTWKKEIWSRDLDSYYCCPGGFYDECGCGGVTVRDLWTSVSRKATK